jgi:hypothetical protein
MGERQTREALLSRRLTHAKVLQVDVEGRLIVEGVDTVSAAAGDEHRLTDPPPAVPHADPQRRIGGDPSSDNRVGKDLIVIQLERPRHLQVVARASTDQRHAPTDDPVRTPDDLLLIAGKAVSQQQQHSVRPILPRRQTARRTRPRVA